MAEAMQGGVMSLPPEMGGMPQPPQSYLTPEDETTLTQLRNSVSPQEFNQEMFNAAEQMDPQAVAQLRSMLRSMQLPQELIDLMKEMVSALLQEPANYAENRRQLVAEGVPEELLPPEFDPNYLMALDMALDQISQPVIQGFAAGGFVQNPISAGIASLGRNGDTMLAHITPREARMLQRAGGAGTINPVTGLPEFFLGGLFKAIGSAFRAVGRAVTSVVKGIGNAIKSFASSTVGRIVTSIGLGFFLGPAAASFLGVTSAAGVAAISGFVGGAGSTLLAGGSLKDALKTGAIGGLTAGAFSGVTGGAGAFKAGSYTGPTTVSESWKSFTEKLGAKPATENAKAVSGPAEPAAAPTGVSPEGAVPNLDELKFDAISGRTAAVPTDTGFQMRPLSSAPAPTEAWRYPNAIQPGQVDPRGFTQITPDQAARVAADPRFNPNLSANAQYDKLFPSEASTYYRPSTFDVSKQLSGVGGPASVPPTVATPPGLTDTYYRPSAFDVSKQLSGVGGPAPVSPAPVPPTAAAPDANYLLSPLDKVGGPNRLPVDTSMGGPSAVDQRGVMQLLKDREYTKAAGRAYDYISPTEIQRQGVGDAIAAVQKQFPGVTPDQIINAPAGSVLNTAFQNAMPGMLATYGPLTAVGLGGTYLLGGFTPTPAPTPDIPESGAKQYARNPYLITPQIRTISASTGQPYRMAAGGIASLAQGSQRFPRKTGPIDGPGTGTSDSIPAMLSDGEFVFTAKAVRAMGKGSRRKGAKRMYALMKALEKRA